MKGSWVYERTGNHHRFDPVWPAEYAEQFLFRGVPKVVVFSATLRPKTASILGIRDADRDFNEYPSTFPAERRPVYHVPTCQMNHRTTDDQLKVWLARIDQIVESRQDRKGIIHTVSFQRRDLVLRHSEFRSIMYSNDSRNTRAVVENFKAADPPAVLVSPSVTTGWDFPYETCRYLIVGKLPFPDTRSAIYKARCESDKDYQAYVTMQVLVQMAGRGMRAENDLCEIFVIDDNIRWFLYRNKQFCPKWFIDSYQELRAIPPPIALPE